MGLFFCAATCCAFFSLTLNVIKGPFTFYNANFKYCHLSLFASFPNPAFSLFYAGFFLLLLFTTVQILKKSFCVSQYQMLFNSRCFTITSAHPKVVLYLPRNSNYMHSGVPLKFVRGYFQVTFGDPNVVPKQWKLGDKSIHTNKPINQSILQYFKLFPLEV